MADLVRRFPARGLSNRVLQEVEDELASLPMVLVTPVLSAVLATVLAVSLPASRVRVGIVQSPPIVVSLGLAVLGAVSGIALVSGLLAVWFWQRYLRHGDRQFSHGADHPHGNVFPLGLKCTGRFDAQTLGTFEAWVRRPSGYVERCGELQGDRLQNPTRFLFVINAGEPGEHSARWYVTAPGGRRREIARTTLADPMMTPGMRSGRLARPGSQ